MLSKHTATSGGRRRNTWRGLAQRIFPAIVILGTLVLATGCGSDTVSKATEHYTSAKYGFSFDYPPSITVAVGLRKARDRMQVLIPAPETRVDEFGLLLRDSDSDEDHQRLEYDHLLMLVSSADHELTEVEASAALKTRLSEL